MKRRGFSRTARLRTFEIQIHDDWILPASDHHRLAWLIGRSVDLLVWNERRYVDKIARPGLAGEFKVISPAHAGAAANDIENRFELAVMVRSGFCIGLHKHCARP